MSTIALPLPVKRQNSSRTKGKKATKSKPGSRQKIVYVEVVRKRSKRWMDEFRSALRAEIANCMTHGMGVGLSLAGMSLLIASAAKAGDPWKIVSFAIYGTCMVLLYLASTLYHGFLSPRAKKLFKVLDHSAIFLAIAGTYTPFTLVSMRGPWGWTLFIIIWALALGGIAYKMFFVNKYRLISVLIYILMGWLVCIAVKPMFQMIPLAGIVWIAIGGIAYTAGTAFYASSFAMSHMIWHLFVLAGSICHYIAIYFYVL